MAASAALGWRGTPVKWEASLKGEGCDCRGLVAGVAREHDWPEAQAFEAAAVGYHKAGVNEAMLVAGLDRLFDRVAGASLGDPDPAAAIAALAPGDILSFRIGKQPRVQHLAIYSGTFHGAPRMIHAYFGRPAIITRVPLDTYWRHRFAGAWRWRDLETAGEREAASSSEVVGGDHVSSSAAVGS